MLLTYFQKILLSQDILHFCRIWITSVGWVYTKICRVELRYSPSGTNSTMLPSHPKNVVRSLTKSVGYGKLSVGLSVIGRQVVYLSTSEFLVLSDWFILSCLEVVLYNRGLWFLKPRSPCLVNWPCPVSGLLLSYQHFISKLLVCLCHGSVTNCIVWCVLPHFGIDVMLCKMPLKSTYVLKCYINLSWDRISDIDEFPVPLGYRKTR